MNKDIGRRADYSRGFADGMARAVSHFNKTSPLAPSVGEGFELYMREYQERLEQALARL